MSDVDISVSSRPVSRSSSLDTCGLDQQHLALAKAAAQTATMVMLGACLLLCTVWLSTFALQAACQCCSRPERLF